jgi:hypothetical protein
MGWDLVEDVGDLERKRATPTELTRWLQRRRYEPTGGLVRARRLIGCALGLRLDEGLSSGEVPVQRGAPDSGRGSDLDHAGTPIPDERRGGREDPLTAGQGVCATRGGPFRGAGFLRARGGVGLRFRATH